MPETTCFLHWNPHSPFSDGSKACSCGAKARKGDAKRFMRRHPKLCSARQKLAQDLARGTRAVDSEESDARIGRQWDAIERAWRGYPW
jgi:hypothetical protein